MRYVVKLGGATLENPELLHQCAQAIAELVKDGHQVAVVHGGGVQLTRTLKQLGKQSEFVSGLRITDAETRDTALMVLGGGVNKALVASMGAHGQPAVGLSGGDGLVFRARKKRTAPDLGFVGEIVSADPRKLPKRSSSVMKSAIAWHGCSRSLSALITGTLAYCAISVIVSCA